MMRREQLEAGKSAQSWKSVTSETWQPMTMESAVLIPTAWAALTALPTSIAVGVGVGLLASRRGMSTIQRPPRRVTVTPAPTAMERETFVLTLEIEAPARAVSALRRCLSEQGWFVRFAIGRAVGRALGLLAARADNCALCERWQDYSLAFDVFEVRAGLLERRAGGGGGGGWAKRHQNSDTDH